jgi:hypothetical protein
VSSCEQCQLVEDEYARAEAEGMTRDALMLALSAVRMSLQSERADASEVRGELARYRMLVEDMRGAIEAFAESVDDAARTWDAPRGGQHVPYFGDWASAVPSIQQRLRWWARHLRDSAKEGQT